MPPESGTNGHGRRLLFDPPGKWHERYVDMRKKLRVAFFEHHALPVERGVGKRRLVTEKKGTNSQGLERWGQEASRTIDENGPVRLPSIDAAGPKLPLLDEDVERPIARTRPGVAHGGRRDAKEYILERSVREIVVRPDRPWSGGGISRVPARLS